MSLIVMGLAVSVVAFTVWAASDPEFVEEVKSIIYSLAKLGYSKDNILYVMRLYI